MTKSGKIPPNPKELVFWYALGRCLKTCCWWLFLFRDLERLPKKGFKNWSLHLLFLEFRQALDTFWNNANCQGSTIKILHTRCSRESHLEFLPRKMCRWHVRTICHVRLCDPIDCSPTGYSIHGDSPDKNTGMGCHFLLKGSFSNRGIKPVSPTGLLHCRRILYRWATGAALLTFTGHFGRFTDFRKLAPVPESKLRIPGFMLGGEIRALVNHST